ncbi:hypothetical protein B0A50_02142 [Salinomyces thailandicus]|uniref:Ketoreductase domain-containing protein n=1 Tax=Salinomyces thailandicus TaxID=706561 RepID=A0A4U0U8B7_9PEZI|nr:hypothetical protein B0A50_02142 [Salinomyces thailandica]
MAGRNVHDLEFREAKRPQASPSVSVGDLFRLDNRTVVITGAAGFLGVEVAIAILQSGGDVVAMDVRASPPPAEWAPVEAAAETMDVRLTYISCDVTDADDVTNAFEKMALDLRHPIRGLVACAGISDNGPAIDFPASSLRRMLDVNVTGTFLVAQAAAKQMIQANGVDTAGYNASKAAVHQLARSLAAEWGSRVNVPLIRVNSLSPGYIRTAATAEALEKPGMEAQWTGDNMLFRLSTADEFRAPILFLLGDGSSFMTAADLRVDGGHCAW